MTFRPIRIAVTALAGWLAANSIAHAHPHVWVTMKSVLVYAPDGRATGIRQSWTFDDMYSAFAVQGLDHKDPNKFTREELQPLAKVNVESLKEYDYFSFAKADGKTAPFTDPVDYWLESNDAILTLHFLLPFKAPIQAKVLVVEVFDPEYFIDFELDKANPVTLSGAPAGCALSIGKPQEMTPALALRLSQVPVDGKIPANTYGEVFANKINVKCP